MLLDRVTITGADDSVNPGDLVALSEEFPFVEWGILMSQSQEGMSRFPSRRWMDELCEIQQSCDLRLSSHLCGRWVRQLMAGERPELPSLAYQTQRIQLNFHAERFSSDPDRFVESMSIFDLLNVQIIVQWDGVNDRMLRTLAEALNRKYSTYMIVPLFDTSGGIGQLPQDGWPAPIPDTYCGYAGGLGPENLREQLQAIQSRVDHFYQENGENPIWIDMETRVRSNNDRQFDLDKVRTCLEIAAPMVDLFE